MGGGDLLSILIQTIKSKMTGLVTKIKLYTNWNFIKNKIVVKIREFFANLLGVKPRNRDDYFIVGRWMISKRLAYAAVIIIGVLSVWYVSTETSLFKQYGEDGVRTYKYNSFRLRTAKGHVKIKGKSGYLAYDGNVENGYVTGNGALYNKEGNMVYQGAFDKNKYEGNGTQYYDDGNMKYNGAFHENLYEGNGTLYRQDGTRIYTGAFVKGMKYGEGVLFDTGENEIYAGTFANDSIVFSELLGKTVAEVNNCYKGHRNVFTTTTESVAVMDSIGALYHAKIDEDALEDEEIVDSVYVLDDHFLNAGKSLDTVTDLTEVFGNPVYEGNSNVILPEAVAINLVNRNKKALNGNVTMDLNYSFSDVAEVNSFDREYVVYITSFQRGDIIYSFVSGSDDNLFSFYYLTGAQDDSST
ncbi:MAG: hypothetical protein IJU77_06355 [Butyrivibrio sp.]|nr:hypothetical protein [Butyrivibrio sp.]